MRLSFKNGFYGWTVVAAAFVVAVFGWGVGFYGPPVFLDAVQKAHGWSLPLVSAAVTAHFLIGALAVANLPALHVRFGLAEVTKAGALSLALGVLGWALAAEPWQLLAATILSGAGWVALGAAAINAIVSPWFVRGRPAALAMAYNGASVGGVLFSPLWVAAIGWLGFAGAATVIGCVMIVVLWLVAVISATTRCTSSFANSIWATSGGREVALPMPTPNKTTPAIRNAVSCPDARMKVAQPRICTA